jgi:hypothetical protein
MDEQARGAHRAALARSKAELYHDIEVHQRRMRRWRLASRTAGGKQWIQEESRLRTQGKALATRLTALLVEDVALDGPST